MSQERSANTVRDFFPGATGKSKSWLEGNILSLDDFEQAAKRILPRPVFGYVSGGAENNQSLHGNIEAFNEISFMPYSLRRVGKRSQSVNLFGKDYTSPFGIAPMGSVGISAYRGDIVMAQAARKAGIPMILSGMSLVRLEEVEEAAPGIWFQAYLPGEWERIDALMQRVQKTPIETLVITVDVPVGGNRENLIREGFSTPLRPSLRLMYDGLIRPRWLFGTWIKTFLRHGMPYFENAYAERGVPLLSRHVMRDFSNRDNFAWEHIEKIRANWKGKLILKGILHPQDAVKSREVGADAIIVSNHGGRQLDGAVAPIRILPHMVAAAKDMPVMLDGGIRRGSDVLKALALGAKFVFVGRPFNYALSVAGEDGVFHAGNLLATEIDRNLALLGVHDCSEIDQNILYPSD